MRVNLFSDRYLEVRGSKSLGSPSVIYSRMMLRRNPKDAGARSFVVRPKPKEAGVETFRIDGVGSRMVLTGPDDREYPVLDAGDLVITSESPGADHSAFQEIEFVPGSRQLKQREQSSRRQSQKALDFHVAAVTFPALDTLIFCGPAVEFVENIPRHSGHATGAGEYWRIPEEAEVDPAIDPVPSAFGMVFASTSAYCHILCKDADIAAEFIESIDSLELS